MFCFRTKRRGGVEYTYEQSELVKRDRFVTVVLGVQRLRNTELPASATRKENRP